MRPANIPHYSFRLLLVASLWFLTGPMTAKAELYQHPVRGFTLELPPGWVQMTKEELGIPNSLLKLQDAKSPTGKLFQFDAGFLPIDEVEGSPNILVMFDQVDLSRISSEEIGRSFGVKDFRQEARKLGNELMQNATENLEFGKFSWDTNRNRGVMRAKRDAPGEGTEIILTTAHATQDGFVYIYCYSAEDQLDSFLPLFEAFNDSLKIAPGQEHRPQAKGFNINDLNARRIGNIVGGIIAAVCIAAWFGRRKTTKGKPDEEIANDNPIAP